MNRYKKKINSKNKPIHVASRGKGVFLFAAALIVFLALLVSACGGVGEPDTTESSRPSETSASATYEEEMDKLFVCGLLSAQGDNGKWGYFDKTAQFVIEPQFDRAYPFSANGLATVVVDGKQGCIDKTGQIVIEPEFDGGAELLCKRIGSRQSR